ncbi:MAG: hypothetical protein AAFO29_01420 [Actinomycetota bacterium]
MSGLGKEFDYRVPARWADQVDIGTVVRVDLHGRRVAAWVVAVDVEPPAGVELRTITKVSSVGPPADVIELANWTAHRWSGRPAAVLRTASPPRTVAAFGQIRDRRPGRLEIEPSISERLDQPGVTVVRVAPTDDGSQWAAAAALRGNALVLCPGVGWARRLAGQLGRQGIRAHLQPGGWAGGATGGVVVGTRSAAFAPTAPLDTVIVLDEHDEALQEERNPTWHARDVAIERARRAGAPCLLISPAPSLSALAAADRVLPVSRSEERRGWPAVEVIDRRSEEPGRGGLFSDRAAEVLRTADRPVAILNRKGRAAMLACASCGELVRTEDGTRLMVERDGGLVQPETGETRPMICAVCTGTTLKRIRLGVTRAAEELAHLVGRQVTELSADTDRLERGAVVLGTEAALHADLDADAVVFLDMDQELLAPRYRAAEQAMGLLVRAARLIGGRRQGSPIVVQTRSPEHRVLRAAVAADPSRLVEEERAVRAAIGFPPTGALAEVGGAGAAAFLAPLAGRDGVMVLGPREDGRHLVRTDDADSLADVLASLPRPKERVRVAVDPPRA